jgi:hypothetical protein
VHPGLAAAATAPHLNLVLLPHPTDQPERRLCGNEAMISALLKSAALCLILVATAGCVTGGSSLTAWSAGRPVYAESRPAYGYGPPVRVPYDSQTVPQHPYWNNPRGAPRPYWQAPRPRSFSPNPGVVCNERKAVCYKWHNGSREWRADRSDTRDVFGKKAARRLNQ